MKTILSLQVLLLYLFWPGQSVFCWLSQHKTHRLPSCTFVHTKPAKDLPELHGRPCSAQNLSVECSHREIPAVSSIGVHTVSSSPLLQKPGLFALACNTDATSGAGSWNCQVFCVKLKNAFQLRFCRFILGIKLFLKATEHAFCLFGPRMKRCLSEYWKDLQKLRRYLKNDGKCSHPEIQWISMSIKWKWMGTGHNEHLWQTWNYLLVKLADVFKLRGSKWNQEWDTWVAWGANLREPVVEESVFVRPCMYTHIYYAYRIYTYIYIHNMHKHKTGTWIDGHVNRHQISDGAEPLAGNHFSLNRALLLDLVRNPETWHILEKPSLPGLPFKKIAIG